jgi:hypothetical protein
MAGIEKYILGSRRALYPFPSNFRQIKPKKSRAERRANLTNIKNCNQNLFLVFIFKYFFEFQRIRRNEECPTARPSTIGPPLDGILPIEVWMIANFFKLHNIFTLTINDIFYRSMHQSQMPLYGNATTLSQMERERLGIDKTIVCA